MSCAVPRCCAMFSSGPMNALPTNTRPSGNRWVSPMPFACNIVLHIPPNSSVSIWRRYWGPYWGHSLLTQTTPIISAPNRVSWRTRRDSNSRPLPSEGSALRRGRLGHLDGRAGRPICRPSYPEQAKPTATPAEQGPAERRSMRRLEGEQSITKRRSNDLWPSACVMRSREKARACVGKIGSAGLETYISITWQT